MRGVVAGCLALVVGIAGCSSPFATHKEQAVAPPRPDSIRFGLNGTGCSSAVFMLLVDAAVIGLPKGYELRDAGDFSNVPFAKGRSAVVLDVNSCEKYEDGPFKVAHSATLGALIKRPVHVVTADNATFDFFILAHFEQDVALAALLLGVAFPVSIAAVALATPSETVAGAVPNRQLTIVTPKGLELLGALADQDGTTAAGTSRFWYNTTLGPGFLDRGLINAPSLGAALGGCKIGAGSVLLKYAGGEICPSDRTFSSLASGLTRSGSFMLQFRPN